VSAFGDAWHWFFQSAQWSGADGIPARLGEHLYYSALALLFAVIIAVPLGLLIGHTNRGGFLVVNSANAARALPTVGVVLLVVVLAGIGLLPVLVPLIALAIPPILVNTYEGIRQVEPELVDASRGMGLREHQVLMSVEVPVATPLILLGVRTAAIQIVSTATIAAYVGLGGLGRFIFDGLARQEYPTVIGGAILVVALALSTELIFVGAQKLLVPTGLQAQRS
jgi:osmoprotectant transport system permease protein